ncbi:hypothetical protein [Helicobacter sp.]|uniref:hypothetical protein n=1 Tax=Helicobacter sp. TaxID=218 RepID=UPI0019B84B6A|nr:hypothetical protein [Helicobacter sp.]MBD5165989.1 hypothetical protein [Helicobacter sp.]
MKGIIEKAFIQAIQDTLEKTPTRCNDKLLRGYISSIDLIFGDDTKGTVTFVSSKEFLNILSFGLFGEHAKDDLTLQDLSQELANLTIGLSKVIAIKEEKSFNINTPRVFGYGEFQDKQYNHLNFTLEGAPCSLFLHR